MPGSRVRRSAIHMLALAVAEKPLEEHELWLRDQARGYHSQAPAASAEDDVEAGFGPPDSSAAAGGPAAAAGEGPSPARARRALAIP